MNFNSNKNAQNSSNNNLKIGDIAPDFELLDTNQNVHKLSNYDRGNTILAFFVGAGTSVCTREMCTFRDDLDKLKSNNANLIGISVDSPAKNKVFAEEHNLNFPILSDSNKEVINKYNILMPSLEDPNNFKAKRSIFVLDNSRRIIYKWVTDNPLIEPNYEEIKETLFQK